MKNAILIVLAIVVVVIAIVSVFMLLPFKKVYEMDPQELNAYTLRQTEFQNILGNEEILNYQIAPIRGFTQENLDILMEAKPSCGENVAVGDSVLTVTYFTYNRDIYVIYSTESNEMVCVFSINK